MRTTSIALALLLLVSAGWAPKEKVARDRTVAFHHGSRVRFATIDEARTLLGTADDWVRALSPLDRQMRLQLPVPVDQASFLEYVSAQALGWDDDDVAAMTKAIENVAARLETLKLELDLPEEILLVRTTGKEEGGGAYTRANAIVMPTTPAKAESLFLHELFHVMTRHDPAPRVPLYRIIGFEPCPPLTYPPALRPRKVTNPDAFHFDAAIRVTVDGETLRVIPLTLGRSETYTGGSLFANLSVELLAIETADGRTDARIIDGAPALHGLDAVEGYREQIGRNTWYVIHPEEILADNFALAVLGRREVPDPQILDAVLAVLSKR